MLPRNLRTGGSELPGAESSRVPLIGYRPLPPDGRRSGSQSGCSAEEAEPLQVDANGMKTTWYCPLDLSTVEEEEEDGVIYTVVVRQQRAPPPSLRSWVSRSLSVKAGTEEKLVLHLLHSSSMGDSSFISIFLSTYRSFTSTESVLDILTDRLETPPGEQQSHLRLSFNRAVSSVFNTWVRDYPEDFQGLGEPSRLLRLAPLLPHHSSDTCDLRAHLLKVAEGLSETALLSDSHRDPLRSPPDTPDTPDTPDNSCFQPSGIMGFPAGVIAEQLTRIETELFLGLVPHHCLGSLWSQRDKKGQEGRCWSARATVTQFNRLANAVQASVLWSPALPRQQRALLLEQWVSVAQECRLRRNFSSLYSVVSALQSNSIHRLRKTWQEIHREVMKTYEELCQIFSDEDNYRQSRELLRTPGAGGTVPYLGIFLTDLTMLDAAVKDRLDNGYINFDKRKREFEVLSQIRLLQTSCRNSVFLCDEAFLRWYQSVPMLTRQESYNLSNEIEAPGDPSPRGLTPTVVITQCPDLSPSRSSLPGDSDFLFDFSSPVNNLLSKLSKHMRSPSVSCLDVDSPPSSDSSPSALTPSTTSKSHRRSASCGNNPLSNLQGSGPDIQIIRIRMELQDGNLYRSIMVSSDDKTPAVISTALEKHSQDPREAPHYELVQLLPEGKELLIPATGNVFYAMTSTSLDFLLRRKDRHAPLGLQPISKETSATFPRIKAKGRRLVRTLF